MVRPNKNHESKKENLIKLAFNLFVEQGYENTTITHIMKSAGLTKAGMYHYFSSKEDILDATIDYGITKDIREMQELMQGLSVEKKMLLFIEYDSPKNELLQALWKIKKNNKDSYVAYRTRDRLIHLHIPIVEQILKEGMEQGIYKKVHPRQIAELMVVYGRAIAEPNVLPTTSEKDIELRISTLLDLIDTWLHPASEHMEQMTASFKKVVLTLKGEK